MLKHMQYKKVQL